MRQGRGEKMSGGEKYIIMHTNIHHINNRYVDWFK